MANFKDVFKQIDTEWIKEHPELMLETFNLLCAELDRRKEVIEILREKEMMLTAIIESNKEE